LPDRLAEHVQGDPTAIEADHDANASLVACEIHLGIAFRQDAEFGQPLDVGDVDAGSGGQPIGALGVHGS
jgi:hypothetical protein